MRNQSLAVFVVGCVIALVCPAFVRAAPLVIATVPVDSAEIQEGVFGLLSGELSKRLGQEVSFKRAESYAAIIKELEEKKIDVALIGAVTYLQVRKKGARVVAKAMRSNRADYRGAIVVRADSGIDELADLKGKTIAMVDEFSTTGYLYPLNLLESAKLKKDKDFMVKMVGGHHKVVDAVLKNEVTAGACFEGAWEQLETAKDIRVVNYTTPVPGDAMVVRAGLDAALVTKLTDALLKLEDLPDGESFLLFTGIDKFVAAKDADYDRVGKDLGIK